MSSQWTRKNLHGVALVLFGALVPVGEGAAFGALGLVALALLSRWREIDVKTLTRGANGAVHTGLLIWLAAGAFALLTTSQAWLKPSELGLWSPFLAIPLLVLSAPLVDDKWLTRAAVAFVAVAGVASLYGIAQYLLDARPGENLFRFDKGRTAQIAVPGAKGGTVAGGFFFHRLKMAHVLLPAIGVVFVRQLFAELSLRRRALEIAILGTLLTAFLLTFTRGALLGVLTAMAVCLPFASRRLRWASLIAVGLAVAAGASLPTVRDRALSIASSEAMQVRGFIWARGVRIAVDHPMGAGLGNYPGVVENYYDLTDPHFDVLTYPHSIVMAALAETGPVGLIAYLWMWAGLAAACLSVLRRAGPWQQRTVAAAGLFGIVAFWAVGLTHDVLFHKPVNLAFSGMVGWILVRLPSAESNTTGGER